MEEEDESVQVRMVGRSLAGLSRRVRMADRRKSVAQKTQETESDRSFETKRLLSATREIAEGERKRRAKRKLKAAILQIVAAKRIERLFRSHSEEAPAGLSPAGAGAPSSESSPAQPKVASSRKLLMRATSSSNAKLELDQAGSTTGSVQSAGTTSGQSGAGGTEDPDHDEDAASDVSDAEQKRRFEFEQAVQLVLQKDEYELEGIAKLTEEQRNKAFENFYMWLQRSGRYEALQMKLFGTAPYITKTNFVLALREMLYPHDEQVLFYALHNLRATARTKAIPDDGRIYERWRGRRPSRTTVGFTSDGKNEGHPGRR